jgi:phosphohistidine phosphatase
MKRLLILRHVKSDWGDPGLDDFDRPLAPRGERAGGLMAAFLARAAVAPDLVLCSAAARAKATLALVRPALPDAPVVFERDLYVFEHGPLLARLRRLDPAVGTVLVVGHNPALEDLTLSLAGPDSDPAALAEVRTKFPTGALADLACPGAWADLKPLGGRLTAFTRPRDLETPEPPRRAAPAAR